MIFADLFAFSKDTRLGLSNHGISFIAYSFWHQGPPYIPPSKVNAFFTRSPYFFISFFSFSVWARSTWPIEYPKRMLRSEIVSVYYIDFVIFCNRIASFFFPWYIYICFLLRIPRRVLLVISYIFIKCNCSFVLDG